MLTLVSGALLSAESPEDDRRCLELLAHRADIDPARALELADGLGPDRPWHQLVRGNASPEAIERAGRDRAEENLARFVAANEEPTRLDADATPPRWAHWVHPLEAVLDEVIARVDRAASLHDDDRVVRGDRRPADEQEGALASRLASAPQRVSEVISGGTDEHVVTRAALADLVSRGVASLYDEGDEGRDEGRDEVTDIRPEDTGRIASSFDQWKSRNDAQLEEDELDFFTDHDHVRGAPEDGQFSSIRKEERVDVKGPPPGSQLPDEEAFAKIAVGSDVLRIIAVAFNEASPGTGGIAMNVVVAGGPNRHRTLFEGAEVDSNGVLTAAPILANVRKRPIEQQRLALRDALADLIDRALSAAADELGDEAVDAILEGAAGYRTRLGL